MDYLIIKRFGNSTTWLKYRFINDNLFISSEWNAGILGIKAEVRNYNCKKLLQTHYSITPLFLPRETSFLFHWGHYSHRGVGPMGRRPIVSEAN